MQSRIAQDTTIALARTQPQVPKNTHFQYSQFRGFNCGLAQIYRNQCVCHNRGSC